MSTAFYYFLWFQAFGTFIVIMVNLYSPKEAGLDLYRKAFGINLFISAVTLAFFDRCASSIAHASLSFVLAGLCVLRPAALIGSFLLAAAHFSQVFLHQDVSAYPLLAADAGALSCAASLLAMVLGHSYLTRPQMSFDLLKRATLGLFILILVDASVVASLAIFGIPDFLKVSEFLLWMGLSKLFFGIIAGGILAFLSYRCALMFSNRSATGILYVVCVFTVIGSASGIYFFSKIA